MVIAIDQSKMESVSSSSSTISTIENAMTQSRMIGITVSKIPPNQDFSIRFSVEFVFDGERHRGVRHVLLRFKIRNLA